MKNLQNKIVFITGGANGIGKAIVKAFCEAGADVTFCDMDEIAGQQLKDEMRSYKCSFVHLDVIDAGALTNTVNTILSEKGNIDILINNVGVGNFGSILDVSVEEFDKTLEINLRPVFITAKLLAKHRSLYKDLNSYGRIINMSSTRYLMSEPDTEAYAASKGAVVSLTHALAVSLSRYNITVNCISPGWIDTGHYGELRPIDHNQHPSGRVGRPEDIAGTCLFLCDPANDFINGQNIVVDGGMTKKMIYVE
ncbi:MAG: SDR family oxidoreductase [Prevotella sp.]|jgi:NAD(P)-dependent dehydrogenase (short-subunit alcohol dehydrogenase family)|nr:SDR family oxidoreductase [Prevotella sp.]